MPDWGGRKVVCIASGPSLTAEDCELVRAAGHPTIVTNTTFRLCVWADALFAFDLRWWRIYIEEVRRTFGGALFTASMLAAQKFGATFFRGPANSGACAANLALARGASEIVLLGYDASFDANRKHWHADHPPGLENAASIVAWPAQFERFAGLAARRGVKVMNASRRTALTCFPRVELEAAL